MLRLYLYARVRICLCTFARETAGAASTRRSLRPLLDGRTDLKSPGETRRGNAEVRLMDASAASLVVVARLDRAIQYSRDVGDRAEKPRRTGSPGQAGR